MTKKINDYFCQLCQSVVKEVIGGIIALRYAKRSSIRFAPP